jgi:mannan endo-1,4-beta-mannosidase
MDLYVQAFKPGGTHDLFYTDPTIINAFKNYLAKVIPRYANNPAVLGWELGNDLRCSSTFPASSTCNPAIITKWVAEICEELTGYFLLTKANRTFHDSGIHQNA